MAEDIEEEQIPAFAGMTRVVGMTKVN